MGTKGAATADQAPEHSAEPHERRRHRRVELPLKARYMLRDGGEHVCEIENISVGGAMLKAETAGAPGERVILYIEQIGRFEAHIVRTSETGFAVRFLQHAQKAHRTADALTWLLNGGESAGKRAAPRLRQNKQSSIRMDDGSETPCIILDISLTGASIGIDPRPPIGTNLHLGLTAARVVRHHPNGVGVMFTGSSDASCRMSEVMRSLKKK